MNKGKTPRETNAAQKKRMAKEQATDEAERRAAGERRKKYDQELLEFRANQKRKETEDATEKKRAAAAAVEKGITEKSRKKKKVAPKKIVSTIVETSESDGDEQDESGESEAELATPHDEATTNESGHNDDDDDDDDDDDNRVDMITLLNEAAAPDIAGVRTGRQHDGDFGYDGRAGLRSKRNERAVERPQEMKNVKQRIVLFVKNTVFRTVKFVSHASFPDAFEKVLREEPPLHPTMFMMTYEKSFNHALNTKRSTCAQAGEKMVARELKNRAQHDVIQDFFTFEEFCKMRRAQTDREKQAFFWFYDTFLGCVCGANAWNYAKAKQLVSEAKEASGMKIVTPSDEAFALLLIDNYLENCWKERAAAVRNVGTLHDENSGLSDHGIGAPKKGGNKKPGKYTAKANGQCKYGGWSDAGRAQFNYLRRLVKEDREADKMEGKRMEKQLLEFCKQRSGARGPGATDAQGLTVHGAAVATAQEAAPVEAEFDTDDDASM
jgi:hypothetical protein